MTVNETPLCLSVNKLGFWYDPARIILNNVSLTIHQQELLVILGPNGAGKSTLLQLLLGLQKAKRGAIRWHGVLDDRSLMSYVPQHHHMDYHFPITTKELLLMGLVGGKAWSRRYKKERCELLDKALQFFDLQKYHNNYLGTLSGGQIQKAFIARALINKPKVLFLDEPTQYLDHESRTQLFHYLEDCNKTMTLIIVTHDPHLSQSLPKQRKLLLNNTLIEYTQHDHNQ